MKKLVGWAIVFLIVVCGTIANAADISKIKILEYGIFEAQQTRSVEARDTSSGVISLLNNIKLVKETNTIFADIGTRFGIRYSVEGDINGANVEISVKVLHPRMVNPSNNKELTLDQWTIYKEIGKNGYSGWTFDHSWELVPGDWIIQLWCADRKLAEQSFTIFLKK
jgi:hypothetical protein